MNLYNYLTQILIYAYALFRKLVPAGFVAICSLLATLEALELPYCLQHVPYAETMGIVQDVKVVQIRGIDFPYNSSLIQHQNGYRLFFRFDTPQLPPFKSYIGCVELDEQFNQTQDEYRLIDTKSDYAEDPRALFVNDQLILIYNDRNSFSGRNIFAAQLDKNDLSTKGITNLYLGLRRVEKNWSPFEAQLNHSQKPQLFFQYYINPQVILHLPDLDKPELNFYQPMLENITSNPIWPRSWGQPRGGTPAQKISEDEYLAFFHSSFLDGYRTRWYVMGAYTFDVKAPHKINKISPYPILFKGIYESDRYRDNLFVIFPSGFVIEKRHGQELIHLSCGENDQATKIITLDKQALLASLEEVSVLERTKFRRSGATKH